MTLEKKYGGLRKANYRFFERSKEIKICDFECGNPPYLLKPAPKPSKREKGKEDRSDCFVCNVGIEGFGFYVDVPLTAAAVAKERE